jgi:hypothetical protein
LNNMMIFFDRDMWKGKQEGGNTWWSMMRSGEYSDVIFWSYTFRAWMRVGFPCNPWMLSACKVFWGRS